MNITGKQKYHDSSEEENNHTEKEWDNPKNPEGTEDERDIEQLERQLEEARRRKENLTDDDEN